MLATFVYFAELIALGALILGIEVHAWYIPTKSEREVREEAR